MPPPLVEPWSTARADTTRLGKWILSPGSTKPAPDDNAALLYEDGDEGGDRRVELTYSSSVLKEFLAVIGGIQDELHRRLPPGGTLPFPAHDDTWTGSGVHA
ncbi:hypothetical protein [Streptomyces jumonjinensis]|uniref:hypothetical protein n=1 Tax=Streptomyces jumonjinensis TaxID=1945 RepID=UPI0037A790E7